MNDECDKSGNGERALEHNRERIAQGAEAVIDRVCWMGIDAVEKRRVPKRYRYRDIDEQMRAYRTRAEVRILWGARDAGVLVPRVLDVDMASGLLVMEYIDGIRAKEFIEGNKDRAGWLCNMIGKSTGLLHNASIVHGDLTTSNVIVRGETPVFIDMGMGSLAASSEDMAVDLHLVSEALESTHSTMPHLFDDFLEGYRGAREPEASYDEVMSRLRSVEQRGRYR